MSAIAVDSLRVELGGARILDDVSTSVDEGEWVTLIGPNGAGKTTLLRAIAGLLPAAGSITLGAMPVAGMSRRELARRVAWEVARSKRTRTEKEDCPYYAAIQINYQ